ncbi:MAG: VRR-NUC domain-containing protein [Gammaproteobacteria bacterium]|nr:VRR-NUC domain-containing protein [Gammaproteobacteria bacterium]
MINGVKSATEHQEQATLFRWVSLVRGTHPELDLLHAIPNGGHRHNAVAARMKAEGVRRGVPDLCLPVASGGYHGLYIEMKSRKGRLSSEQRQWGDALHAQGYCFQMCRSWREAATTIGDYLGINPRF